MIFNIMLSLDDAPNYSTWIYLLWTQGGATQRSSPGYNGTPGYCVVHHFPKDQNYTLALISYLSHSSCIHRLLANKHHAERFLEVRRKALADLVDGGGHDVLAMNAHDEARVDGVDLAQESLMVSPPHVFNRKLIMKEHT